jgi:CheY-like chemotaxis protein
MSATIGAFRSTATKEHEADQAMRVLVVDDIVLNRLVLSKMLTKLGCEVVHASNGKEAVDAFAKNDFPLVFMDLLMPVMDGYEATREIRKLEDPQARTTYISAVSFEPLILESLKAWTMATGDRT